MEIVEVAPGDALLAEVFPVMRELRTHLDEAQFKRLYEQSYGENFRIAALFDDGACRAVAGYRLYTNLYRGKQLYIDDLVTTADQRSAGYGKRLIQYLTDLAKIEGCDSLQLDSNVQRKDAHRFYFREGFHVRSFHFERKWGDQPSPI